ncbi:MAG: NUDIX domain-containing protein [Patescibacteria group bacterium]
MKNTLTQEIENLLENCSTAETAWKFKQKLKEGKLTREEDPENHFCAFFAACDYETKQFFIGQHKKSGLWLFNGGHIDPEENIRETVRREIGEE